MTAEAYVNEVPLMIGGRGRDGVRDFYANHFVSQFPPDIEIVPVSRTIGQGQVVDELIMRFTHSIRMDWLLPGIAPTGKRVEVPFVALVKFEGDKIAHEHLYWDQASVLVQVGLLDRTLPVRGGEIAAQVLNPTQPMNELIHRASKESKQENVDATIVLAGRHPPERHRGRGGYRRALRPRRRLVPRRPQVPPHVHRRYSEQFYVLDGEFTVWTAGGRKAVLRRGDDLLIPTGTAHAVAVTGDGPGRALVVTSPSGFARLVTEVGTPDVGGEAPPSATTDMELLGRVAAELGDEILGPPGALPDEVAARRSGR